MTSPQRVRYLLTNRRIILGNLVRAAQTMLTEETEREIIEALCLAAAAYNPDKVQTDPAGEKTSKVIAAKDREMREQDATRSRVYWIAESMAREIEALDMAVLSLKANQQRIIVARYYDCLTRDEAAAKFKYSVANISRIVDKAIADISSKL